MTLMALISGNCLRIRAISVISVSSGKVWELDSHSAISRPFQEASLACLTVELIAFHEHPAAGENDVRHASNFDALEHRVIHAHMVGLGADDLLPIGIEDYQIGVTAYSHRAFARV